MNTEELNQTTKDIAQVVDIVATRQQELGEMVDACPQQVSVLNALREAADGALEKLRGEA